MILENAIIVSTPPTPEAEPTASGKSAAPPPGGAGAAAPRELGRPSRPAEWQWAFIVVTAGVLGLVFYSVFHDGNPVSVDVSGPPLRYKFEVHFSLLHAAAMAVALIVLHAYRRLACASSIVGATLRDTTFSEIAVSRRTPTRDPLDRRRTENLEPWVP